MEINLSGHRIMVARAMQRPKLTQDELIAKMQNEGVSMSKNKLSRIEIGTRYVTDVELVMFAKVLNVSVLWLLGFTGDPKT